MDKNSFLYKNALSIAFASMAVVTLVGQALTGWKVYCEELAEKGIAAITFCYYLTSGHFIQATFENWESEFLQMALYVYVTVFLRQIGSSESKSFDEEEEVDRKPTPHAGAPWPVKKGGWWLKLYSNSLTIAFLLLFVVSFVIHAIGSYHDENMRNALDQKPLISFFEFLAGPRLWFESLQNWQSEFLSIVSIVLLSIYLRQKGSPESKPVDAPHMETGR